MHTHAVPLTAPVCSRLLGDGPHGCVCVYAQVINQLTVLTMLLTQDRCTKNWLMYQSSNSTGAMWSMLPYDLKSSLGACPPTASVHA